MNESIVLVISILTAYVLDLLLGDPHWLPHPVVAFGKGISFFEKNLNKGKVLYLKGVLMTIFLTVSVFFIFYIPLSYIRGYNLLLFAFFNTLFIFFGLANKTLIKESRKVIEKIEVSGIEAGRKQLSCIVGRDTLALSENKIKTAVLETLSENLSDGVVAPLFYYIIGGIPAMMAYKMVNTLDSMIGYKNERYLKFGFFAAKLDDLLNIVPARLTAFIMAALGGNIRTFKFILKYGNAHSSPNAGYPEAALAGILDCRFGGSNSYHGKMVSKPYIGNNLRDINNSDIDKAVWINHGVCFLCIVIICSIEWFKL